MPAPPSSPRQWKHRTPAPGGEVRISRTQRAFRASPATFRGYVGGIGSGKSWVGAYDLLRRAVERPGLYMVTAPTYKVLRDASFRTFRDVASSLNLFAGFSKSEFIATVWAGRR